MRSWDFSAMYVENLGECWTDWMGKMQNKGTYGNAACTGRDFLSD